MSDNLRRGKWLLLALMGLLASACASQKTLYTWGDYHAALLSYYKNPGELQKYADRLSADIQKAEAKDNVPPGMYAEYGYALLKLGQQDQAVTYFQKEEEAWPEARFLMTKVITRLSAPPPEPAPDAPTVSPGAAPAPPEPADSSGAKPEPKYDDSISNGGPASAPGGTQ